MARLEMLDGDLACSARGRPRATCCSSRHDVFGRARHAVDLIAARFNLAAIKGNREAVRLRCEIACQMSDAEIAAAQRAARDWLCGHRVAERPAIAA